MLLSKTTRQFSSRLAARRHLFSSPYVSSCAVHNEGQRRSVASTRPASSPSNPSGSPQVNDLFQRLIKGERVALAKAITLVESTAARHHQDAQSLMTQVLAHLRARDPPKVRANAQMRIASNVIAPRMETVTASPASDAPEGKDDATSCSISASTSSRKPCKRRKSLEMQPASDPSEPLPKLKSTLRLGMSGSPGVGKSTFIEAFGMWLVQRGLRVAVLAVDPSSTRTGGSILGDKTRMHELSRHECAYVRPTPSRGSLGGVARNTCDAVLVCEAAGYDVVLVETVGVGQSEVMVADMVDLMVLLVAPAGGDELQGIKKGIVERADMILVNKADGDLAATARITQTEYLSAIKFLASGNPPGSWVPKVLRVSSAHQLGLDEVWASIFDYYNNQWGQDAFYAKREEQRRKWMWRLISDQLQTRLATDTSIASLVAQLEIDVEIGNTTPGFAADKVVDTFLSVHQRVPDASR